MEVKWLEAYQLVYIFSDAKHVQHLASNVPTLCQAVRQEKLEIW